MYIATPTPCPEEYRRLSTGEIYTPVKSEKPECPCYKCHKECGANICDNYTDYEIMNYYYRHAVFD